MIGFNYINLFIGRNNINFFKSFNVTYVFLINFNF